MATLYFSGLTIPPAETLNRVATPAAARQLSLAGANTWIPKTYGTDRVAGKIWNILPAAANSTNVLVQVVWGHRVGAISTHRFNSLALPAGASVVDFLGDQVAVHSPLVTAFAAQGITYTDTLNGFAYSVYTLPSRAFEGSLNFSALITGGPIYDPRADSTVSGGSGSQRLATPSTWGADIGNPALAEADWLRSSVYGAGEALDWATWIPAANYQDALIGSPTEKRRTINLTISQAAPVRDIAEALRAYAGLWCVPTGSGIKAVIDQDGSAVASYSHASGEIVRMEALTRRDISTEPTTVEVIYTDTSKVPFRDASAFATIGGSTYRLSQVRLPGITRYGQALREATMRLNKLRLGDLATTVEVLEIGKRHEVGDIINLTYPLGLAAKPFRIHAPPERVGSGNWRLPVVEHDPAMYSDAIATAPTIPDTNLVNPVGPPPDVTGMAATAIPGAIRITWGQKPVSDIDVMELRLGTTWATAVRLDTGVVGSTEVDGTVYHWAWPAAGSYTVLFRWRDRDGNQSINAASLAITVTATGISIGAQQTGGTPLGPGTNAIVNGRFVYGLAGWDLVDGSGAWVHNAAYGSAQAMVAPGGASTATGIRSIGVQPGQRWRFRAALGRTGAGTGTGTCWLTVNESNNASAAGKFIDNYGINDSNRWQRSSFTNVFTSSGLASLPQFPAWDGGNIVDVIYTVPAGVASISPAVYSWAMPAGQSVMVLWASFELLSDTGALAPGAATIVSSGSAAAGTLSLGGSGNISITLVDIFYSNSSQENQQVRAFASVERLPVPTGAGNPTATFFCTFTPNNSIPAQFKESVPARRSTAAPPGVPIDLEAGVSTFSDVLAPGQQARLELQVQLVSGGASSINYPFSQAGFEVIKR